MTTTTSPSPSDAPAPASSPAERLAVIGQLVGNTPYLRLRFPDAPRTTFHLKLEAQNPTGSVKDRAGYRMFRHAISSLEPERRPHLLDASSGNMACAIAFFAAILDVPATLVVSSKLTAEKRAFLEYFGASVITVGDQTIDGNRHCRSLVESGANADYLFLDQLHNWENPAAHYETTGPEIVRAFPECRMVVGSLGSGGTLLGTARYLKAHRPGATIVATEAASGSRMPGVGAFDDGDYLTPFILAGIEEKLFDLRVRVSSTDAGQEVFAARAFGVFGGLQTGAVLQAARSTARERGIEGDVVVIAGDSGWKNVEALSAVRRTIEAARQ